MRGKWLLFGGCLVLLAIAGGVFTVWRREQAKPTAVVVPMAAPVVVAGELSLSGKIEARNVVGVKAPSAGTVEEYLVNEGEEVYEGQLLARLKNPSLENEKELAKERADKAQERQNALESQLLAARLEVSRGRAEAARVKEEFTRAERLYQRQSMLNQQGATPRLAFEKSKKDFESGRMDHETLGARQQVAEGRISDLTRDIELAKKAVEERNAALEDAETNLQATQVHAPVDGVIVMRKGEAGAEIQKGEDEVFRIATDLGNLQIVVEPEAAVLSRIKEGMLVAVFVAEQSNEALNGEIARVADGKVTILFLNPNPLIKPGLTAQVRIKLP